MIWRQDPCGDEHSRRSRHTGQILQSDGYRVYLADPAYVDPLTVIETYALVSNHAFAETTRLVGCLCHDVAQLSTQPPGDPTTGLRRQGHGLDLDDQRYVIDDDEAVTLDSLGVLLRIGLRRRGSGVGN